MIKLIKMSILAYLCCLLSFTITSIEQKLNTDRLCVPCRSSSLDVSCTKPPVQHGRSSSADSRFKKAASPNCVASDTKSKSRISWNLPQSRNKDALMLSVPLTPLSYRSTPALQLPLRFFPNQIRGYSSSTGVPPCPNTEVKQKACFQSQYKPKPSPKSQDYRTVSCAMKFQALGACDKKSKVKAFSICPPPIKQRPSFQCPEAPQTLLVPKKPKVDRCSLIKYPPIQPCRKPKRKVLPTCPEFVPLYLDRPEPPPPPTPRRCLRPDDPVPLDPNKKVCKMDPNAPIVTCPPRRKHQPMKIPTSNPICFGVSTGSCGEGKCNSNKDSGKIISCKVEIGDICDSMASYSTPQKFIPPQEIAKIETARQHGSSFKQATTKGFQISTPLQMKIPPKNLTTFQKSSVQRTRAICTKLPSANKKKSSKFVGTCSRIKFPGCPARIRTDCTTITKKAKCTRIPAPTAAYSECSKPLPPPGSRTECDITYKTKHLQPRIKIFVERQKFVPPKPEVDIYIDTSAGECCEGVPAPKPLTCAPPCPPTTDVAPDKEIPPQKTGGCECSFMDVIRSCIQYFTCSQKDKTKQSIKEVNIIADRPVTTPKPVSTARPIDNAKDQAHCPPKLKKTNEKKSKCEKLELPGCRRPATTECIAKMTERQPCEKRLAPIPSFSECMRRPFPGIRFSECRVSMKRAKSLSELKAKGLRFTPETIHNQYTKCLKPKGIGCETADKGATCSTMKHVCSQSKCSRPGRQIKSSPDETTCCKDAKTVCKKSQKQLEQKKEMKAVCQLRKSEHTKDCSQPSSSRKKDCSNIPKDVKPARSKDGICQSAKQLPSNNPPCEVREETCDAEPYRMPKGQC